MKTFLKVFAGVVVLLVIAVAGFVYTFDANNYKEEIAKLAESVTGRPINIAGDMDISLYPWIGIKINDVTIENTSGFSNKTFATIGQFDVRIKIMPLLQKRLDIDKLVLHQLALELEINTAGENNWSDFSGVSDKNNVEPESGLAGLTIGGIDVADSRLTWVDVNTGKQLKLSNLSLSTKVVSKGQPLPVELKAFVESNQPEWQAAVNAKTRLEFNDDSAVFDAKDLKLTVKALLPNTEMEKVTLAMVADSKINLQTRSAKLTNARLGVLGLVMGGTFDVENIFSVPVIQGPVKVKKFEAAKLAKHLNFDIPQMANAQSLGNITLTALFKTDFDSVYMENISANVDQSKVKGFVHITGLSQPVVRYELKADRINLDDYRLVKNELEQDETPLPLDFIRAADIEGVLDVEAITVGDTELHKVHMASNIENDIFNANPITMLVSEGEVKAAMRLDARETPAVSFVAEARQLDAKASINQLLTNILGDEAPVLSGRVDADANLKATGSSATALKTSAQGTIKVNMDKAIVKGIDFDHASYAVVADYAERNNFRVSRTFNVEHDPDRVTEFDRLHATFRVSKGKLINSDLLLESETVNVTGTGSLDFINGKLDYRPVIDMKVASTVNVRDKLRDHPMEYQALGSWGEITTEFDVNRYDLHMGRLMIQEAKANRNRRINSQSENSWQNAVSK
jgi:AsmA protein